MTFKDFLRKKILGIVGLSRFDGEPNEDRLTFINDSTRLIRTKLKEYNIWYEGDGDEILNFYTNTNTFEYAYEPYFHRNKRNYFWAISTTETDIKRTHSGIPKSIVDTLVNITRFPLIRAGKMQDDNNKVNQNLKAILKHANLKKKYRDKQMPLTLVEGWGCWKIVWDQNYSEYPNVVYYRADSVDFVYRNDDIIGVVFRDFYQGIDNKRYLVVETRSLRIMEGVCCLVIDTEVFSIAKDNEHLIKIDNFKEVIPELKGLEEHVEFENCNMLFAVPCIFFEETDKTGAYGKSIFKGKIDQFDDLDQACSQSANSVRKSTPIEYFDSEFLERDRRTGLPKQPRAYDRKYTLFNGGRNADGGTNSSSPVQVTQPNLNFKQYSDEAIDILLRIIHGIISPATLGIDLAKKDNAQAQREKEKVTIFTRNGIIDSETEILTQVCNQLLCAYEFMSTGEITCKDYDISIKFSEFADDSFENKLQKLSEAYSGNNISDEMYLNKLYGDTLSPAEYERELKWLKEFHSEPRKDGMMGAGGDGYNMPGMMGEDEVQL